MNIDEMTAEELLDEILRVRNVTVDGFGNAMINNKLVTTMLDTYCQECNHRVIAWNPTTDIAAAWDLVEELRVKDGCDVVIEVWDRTPPRTTVRVMIESSNHSPQYHGRGMTAPEAISRAYLKWKSA